MFDKLVVEDLHVSVGGKEILKGIDLVVEKGKVHALMGPNGAGKSTLGHVLMGNPKFEVTKGKITIDGKDISETAPHERARLGLFLSFQYPAEIAGVTMSNLLRTARNSIKDKKMDVLEFHKFMNEKMKKLNINPEFSKRYINQGFSGGEKKRAEILQMSVLEPKYAILDECDSGLDINSIKIVGEGIMKQRGPSLGVLIITHYYRILNFVVPDVVSIMIDGKIVQTGGKELAEKIERDGFDSFVLTKEI
jgi:Fe-S cluster assembly ATP-binding protein